MAGNLIGFDDPGLDDLIQEGYIAMWHGAESYDPDKGPLAPRLKYLAKQRMRNVTYGHHRWTGHEPTRGFGHQDPKIVEHYDELEEPEYVLPVTEDPPMPEPVLHQAVSELPDDQKEYIFARFWVGGGAYGSMAGTKQLREQFPVLRKEKVWARARETLRHDPRIQQLAEVYG